MYYQTQAIQGGNGSTKLDAACKNEALGLLCWAAQWSEAESKLVSLAQLRTANGGNL